MEEKGDKVNASNIISFAMTCDQKLALQSSLTPIETEAIANTTMYDRGNVA